MAQTWLCHFYLEAAVEETCDDILTYLNHPLSTGKLYCQRSDLRGHWKDVSQTDQCRKAWRFRTYIGYLFLKEVIGAENDI